MMIMKNPRILPCFALVAPIALLTLTTLHAEELTVWIGTGGKTAKGIYRTTLDTATGKLEEPELVAEMPSTGFVILNKDKSRLYSLSGVGEGSVASFAITGDSSLASLNTQATGDGGAAHLCLDHTEKILFSAQYGGGSVTSYPILEDGSIGEKVSVIEHTGAGPNPQRQKAPHPHAVGVSPDNQFLLVPDLGIDQVMIHRIDHASSSIVPHGAGVTIPGGGPRHFKFSNDGTKVYLLNELIASITTFAYDAKAGTMTTGATVSALPEGWNDLSNSAAEVRVHPTGRFVYSSNRGHDSIAVFKVDEATGDLTPIEHEPIRGATPRNFSLDPSGKWLIAAGQSSNTLSVFAIDPETGALAYTGNIVNCPAPICVTF